MTLSDGVLSALKILVIAEEFESIAALIESLRAAGAVVVMVRTTALALAYSERQTVDIVLVDLREGGWWAAPEMRALRSLSRVPVYSLTLPGDPMREATTGVTGYFRKPVSADSLISTFRDLPRRSR